MTLNLDPKSFLIGVATCAVFAALLGAAQLQVGPTSAIGRFQIDAATTGNSARAYVVDTVTGQVWQEHTKGFHAAKLNAEESPK
jgi:hypothetical protein